MQVPDPLGFDVSIVRRIPVVREILDAFCEVRDGAFAAVACVTEHRLGGLRGS